MIFSFQCQLGSVVDSESTFRSPSDFIIFNLQMYQDYFCGVVYPKYNQRKESFARKTCFWGTEVRIQCPLEKLLIPKQHTQ